VHENLSSKAVTSISIIVELDDTLMTVFYLKEDISSYNRQRTDNFAEHAEHT
jgi:hypothetical protein